MKKITSRSLSVLCRTVISIFLVATSCSVLASACRITDFTDQPVSSLNEIQQLSFISKMTETEFRHLRQAKAGDIDFNPVIAEAESVRHARRSALDKLESFGIENFESLRHIWATDFLTAENVEAYANCVSAREPGLTIAGRPESNGKDFRITLAHITPIGIEKITTRLVASNNIKNVHEFESFLNDIGSQDNYVARSFLLKKTDKKKPSVVVIRAGWETPDLVYIPVYP